ncbi:Integrase [hydrothermal vent metagenome]|uniref:Integrase n=1 Tax=hydrothermal vent metagenome TaxID=652676 RepID=A0A3B0RF23_9ZZZZ
MARLTAIAVKAAKGKAKPYKLSDSEGLYLFVHPNGRRYWRMNYRHLGKQKTLAFGIWPDVSLADARGKRDSARRLLAKGTDPSDQAKLDKIAASVAAANTFKAIAEEWLSKIEQDGLSPVTLKKTHWFLSFIYPALGNRPITEISAHELLIALRKVEARGCYDTANRTLSTCSRVFRYAIATARADRDVCPDLKGALITPTVTHRSAITTANEAGALMRAIGGFEGNALTRTALRLLPHVFVRPGELRFAEWVDFDIEKAVWTIPIEKTKMRKAHSIPLSIQALEILSQIEHDAALSPYFFPSLRSVDRPMSENTINAALRHMGYAKDEMTGHGFRAMAATLLNEMGIWNADAIERQLAHSDKDSVRSAYTRGEYWDERVKMMQHWSDYLDELRVGAKILTGSFGGR